MSTAPVMRTEMRVISTRNLLMERMGVLLRAMCHRIGAGLAQRRKQARRQSTPANSGLFAAMMGRALAAKSARGRVLSIEERLTLGPKQHMYLIRCGEQRLLVASAGESALQWMALPREGELEPEAVVCESIADNSETKPRTKRRTASPRTGTGCKKRSTSRAAATGCAEDAR